MRLKLGRPSPALVVACIAVVIALGPVVRAADTVGSNDIINESILSEDIKNGEVTTDDIGNAAVTSGKIAPDAVTSAALADNSVATANLTNLAVTNGKLAGNAVTSANVVNEALTSADLRGADVSRTFSLGAGVVGIGRCRDVNITVAGAQTGDVAVLSLKGSVQSNLLINAIRVPSANLVTVKVCNFTGAASPPITNLPIRVMTFG